MHRWTHHGSQSRHFAQPENLVGENTSITNCKDLLPKASEDEQLALDSTDFIQEYYVSLLLSIPYHRVFSPHPRSAP